jgi:hypothetical protein
MFAGFNFQPKMEDINRLVAHECAHRFDSDYYNVNKTAITAGLKKYLSLDGSLDAAAMEKDWFPEINAQVFISHSHQDENLANQLALWLYRKHGIMSFIDSTVWHYADDLLREIDDAYCVNQDSDTIYDYSKRNRSTAHVHMLLQGALMKMINKCGCLIFVNTPNSISTSDINDETKTASPWIYNELLTAKMLLLNQRKQQILSEDKVAFQMFQINYTVDLRDFPELTLGEIRHSDSPTEVIYQLYELYIKKVKNGQK